MAGNGTVVQTISIMKKLIIPILAISAFVSLAACRTDDDRRGPYVRHDRRDVQEDRDYRAPGVEVTTETQRSN